MFRCPVAKYEDHMIQLSFQSRVCILDIFTIKNTVLFLIKNVSSYTLHKRSLQDYEIFTYKLIHLPILKLIRTLWRWIFFNKIKLNLKVHWIPQKTFKSKLFRYKVSLYLRLFRDSLCDATLYLVLSILFLYSLYFLKDSGLWLNWKGLWKKH